MQGIIKDTTIFDCAILFENNIGHIKEISSKEDFMKYAPRWLLNRNYKVGILSVLSWAKKILMLDR